MHCKHKVTCMMGGLKFCKHNLNSNIVALELCEHDLSSQIGGLVLTAPQNPPIDLRAWNRKLIRPP